MIGFEVQIEFKKEANIMALLQPEKELKKVHLRVKIDMEVIEMAKEYAAFAGIKKVDDFYQIAAKYIFKHDKDFQQYLQKKKGKPYMED